MTGRTNILIKGKEESNIVSSSILFTCISWMPTQTSAADEPPRPCLVASFGGFIRL